MAGQLGDITPYTNVDDGTPAPVIRDNEGVDRKLGLILPAGYPAPRAKLSSVPGFIPWTKSQIEDAIRTKPKKARELFKGSDWIEDQKQRSSCCPTAWVAGMRKAMFYAGVNLVPKLSAEFLYAQTNRGSDNGAVLEEVRIAGEEIGTILRDDAKHPFNRDILKKNYSPEEYNAAKANRAGVTYEVDDELSLATFVLSRMGGSVVAVDVDDAYMKLNKSGIRGSGTGPGNHAVDLDDCEIVDGQLVFDEAGSWGLANGDGGRAYLTWDRHLKVTNKYHKFFVILSANVQALMDEAPAAKAA